MDGMFRIYQSGQEFLTDNEKILREHPLETCFLSGNARSMPDMSDGFAVRASDVLALRYRDFPMVLYGDEASCGELAAGLWENGLTFGAVLAGPALTDAFPPRYEALAGGTHRLRHAMDIMKCERLHDMETPLVEAATPADAEEIARLALRFQFEALGEDADIQALLAKIRNDIGQFVLIRRDGKIVSLAKRVRETERLCSTSWVYTLEAYRGRGLARQTVTYLTRRALREGKTAYLFVDQKNPISNHLYQSIGYTYGAPQMETTYLPRT